jgi:hypothetical protein
MISTIFCLCSIFQFKFVSDHLNLKAFSFVLQYYIPVESIFSVTLSYTWEHCNYKPKFKLSQHKTLFCRYQYERSILDFALNFEMISYQKLKSLKVKLRVEKIRI